MSLVLVVDDEPAVLEVLGEVLLDLGHEVLKAYDGQEALELARARKPDLIVTDHMMPRLSGADLCRTLREDPGLKAVPAILLSAALSSGTPDAQAFLAKPFELSAFESLVERLLAEHPPRRPGREARSGQATWALVGSLAGRLERSLGQAREAVGGLDDAGGADAVRDARGRLEGALSDLEALQKAVLDAAALANGKVELTRERTEVGALLRQAVERFPRHSDQQIVLNLPDAPVHLSVDEARLRQMVDLMLESASTGCEGALTLDVSQVPGEAIATFHFRCERLTPGQPRPREEDSLELWTVGALARLHKGTLWVDSTEGDAGTSLRVVLPRT
ncbi:MAG TPA: response regulator [Myxococcaceae bacterium]|nr:response regulator [Myxococcaceae bacterium]